MIDDVCTRRAGTVSVLFRISWEAEVFPFVSVHELMVHAAVEVFFG